MVSEIAYRVITSVLEYYTNSTPVIENFVDKNIYSADRYVWKVRKVMNQELFEELEDIQTISEALRDIRKELNKVPDMKFAKVQYIEYPGHSSDYLGIEYRKDTRVEQGVEIIFKSEEQLKFSKREKA